MSSSGRKTYVLPTDTDPQIIKVLRRFDGVRRQDLFFVQASQNIEDSLRWSFEPRKNPNLDNENCVLVGPFSSDEVAVHMRALSRNREGDASKLAYLDDLVARGEAIRWKDR